MKIVPGGTYMRARYLAGMALLAVIVAPAISLAASQEDIADVRCLAVAFRISQLPAAEQKSGGVLMAIYYLGRLDGRAPDRDIEELIIDQITKMTNDDYRTEAVRCGNSLTEKGRKITQLGEDLSRREKQLQQPPVPTS
jgi:hypothetical protein